MRCRIRCGIVYEHDRLNTHTHTSQMRKWNANVLTSYGLIWLSCVYLTPSVTCQCRVLDAQKSMPRPAWTPSFAERDQHTMLRSCSRRPSLFSQLVVLESINRRCVERNHEDNSDSNGFQFQNSPRNSGCQGFAAKRRLHCRVPWSTLIPTHLFAAASHLTETDFTTSRTYQKIDNEARIGCTSYCFVFE